MLVLLSNRLSALGLRLLILAFSSLVLAVWGVWLLDWEDEGRAF